MTRAKLNRQTGIPLKYANRHGLITGQTGTGKTVTLQRLAEQFSKAGVPVFISDVKGDIAALSRSCPVTLLDVFGDTGKPLSVTIEAMGADLMARALELTDAQAGCLEIAFAWAERSGAPIQTIADLREILRDMTNIDMSTVFDHFGHVSGASVAVIMRALLRIESQGGNKFFNGPCFDVADLLEVQKLEHYATGMQDTVREDGLVSILQSEKLLQSPRVYAAFLLWLLSDLYQRMPEIGDCDKPRLVFFFDEAHLLFDDIPAALLRRIEQTVRLIRSKGVGVYFVSQRPDDIPPIIRSQLAHTIEHDRSLPVGTARFQTMTATGTPAAVATIKIDLPDCPLGALSTQERLPHAPMPKTAPAAVSMSMDWHGYVFLMVAAAALCGIAGLAWYIGASGQIGFAVASAVAVWLAIRKRI